MQTLALAWRQPANLDTVRQFVTDFLAKYDRLDGLACNAGMVNMGGKANYTKDGLETTIGISYFGHFLLTELLLDILKKAPPLVLLYYRRLFTQEA